MDESKNAPASSSASVREFQVKLPRLIALTNKPRLDDEQERNERDELLRYFRRNGYTSAEISGFTRGNLKEDTIKRITKRILIEDTSLKDRVAEIVGDMVRADLGFAEVRRAASINNALPEGIAVQDLSSLLVEVQQSPDAGGVQGVISMYREMKEQQDLTFSKVKEFLAYQQELRAAGLQTRHLHHISDVAKKYKMDVNLVMGALSSFDSLESLKDKVKREDSLLIEANEKREKAENDSKSAVAEYDHLREAIVLCKDMIQKYGFARAALNDVYELTKRCGNPAEVMNVLAEYKEMKELSVQKTRLSSEVNELQDSVEKLKGQQEGIANSITGLLTPISNEISKAITDAIKSITSTYQGQLTSLKAASQEYGERLGKGLALKEELEFAKVINLILKHPLDAKKLSLDYAIIMLDAVKKLLSAKRVEAKIKAGRAGINASVMYHRM